MMQRSPSLNSAISNAHTAAASTMKPIKRCWMPTRVRSALYIATCRSHLHSPECHACRSRFAVRQRPKRLLGIITKNYSAVKHWTKQPISNMPPTSVLNLEDFHRLSFQRKHDEFIQQDMDFSLESWCTVHADLLCQWTCACGSPAALQFPTDSLTRNWREKFPSKLFMQGDSHLRSDCHLFVKQSSAGS